MRGLRRGGWWAIENTTKDVLGFNSQLDQEEFNQGVAEDDLKTYALPDVESSAQ